MRIRHNGARTVLVVALATVAFGAVVSSATAVNVEPLNTKFTGSSAKLTWRVNSGSIENIECTKATFEGTSQSTKVNFVTVTPTFGECTATIASGGKYTASFTSGKCTNGLKVTFTEAGHATVKVTCTLAIYLEEWPKKLEDCEEVIAPETTVSGTFYWADVPTKSLELDAERNGFAISSVENRAHCIGWNYEVPLKMEGAITLKGIEAH
jgi:hypothetical protein